MIKAAREAVDLLIQAASSWQFDGALNGLRDREWMALRFLARANRFSRTPSALAQFVGTTRATASQTVKRLEDNGYVQRRSADQDKRSVILDVTPRGEKILASDPIAPLVHAIAALELGASNFRDLLRQILEQLDARKHRHHADSCRQCIFLTESATKRARRTQAEYTCRFFRADLSGAEVDLLCFNFEPWASTR
ncbi:MarR family transcriptional regulator [Bradyrhizobium japonicum]|uniref:MarR family transcriptional regulator n=1 Tax=Bradyrhizobium japonicum TaxID=375 RepID=UPI00057CC2C2|nr:MarR family transcriptional regulator [Bradyrhizobium japonicum]MCS3975333.1 DNA-binding MarR family transcriptional regulator [Bradyrhizobium japonicum]MEB2677079.1 MarR family transcriptional regulator [Bradyrhizobium japonicum]WRI69345.1 MarR family transcriptional regulator [Bradyrhizobium japonicum]WRI78182.1 MarR family transcriptional regulator [Bradyrhizobium japonicum]WRI87385.1 MarR family transcriptional regulator [Bradyrhizobium japonicum]